MWYSICSLELAELAISSLVLYSSTVSTVAFVVASLPPPTLAPWPKKLKPAFALAPVVIPVSREVLSECTLCYTDWCESEFLIPT